jgi:hypothetical protein
MVKTPSLNASVRPVSQRPGGWVITPAAASAWSRSGGRRRGGRPWRCLRCRRTRRSGACGGLRAAGRWRTRVEVGVLEGDQAPAGAVREVEDVEVLALAVPEVHGVERARAREPGPAQLHGVDVGARLPVGGDREEPSETADVLPVEAPSPAALAPN